MYQMEELVINKLPIYFINQFVMECFQSFPKAYELRKKFSTQNLIVL